MLKNNNVIKKLSFQESDRIDMYDLFEILSTNQSISELKFKCNFPYI